MLTTLLNLALLCVVSFVQNMAFTWSSRSRNSGNPKYHFFVATASNGIWFVCNFFLILPEMLKVIENGDLVMKLVVMLVYTISTALGSAFMMKILLKKEKGSHKVGANQNVHGKITLDGKVEDIRLEKRRKK